MSSERSPLITPLSRSRLTCRNGDYADDGGVSDIHTPTLLLNGKERKEDGDGDEMSMLMMMMMTMRAMRTMMAMLTVLPMVTMTMMMMAG